MLAEMESGSTCREAAEQFGVGKSTAGRWKQEYRRSGRTAAAPMGGDRRSSLDGERDWLLGRVAATPDATLEELREQLRRQGTSASYGALWRFFAKAGITFKKNAARGRAGPSRRGRRPRRVA